MSTWTTYTFSQNNKTARTKSGRNKSTKNVRIGGMENANTEGSGDLRVE